MLATLRPLGLTKQPIPRFNEFFFYGEIFHHRDVRVLRITKTVWGNLGVAEGYLVLQPPVQVVGFLVDGCQQQLLATFLDQLCTIFRKPQSCSSLHRYTSRGAGSEDARSNWEHNYVFVPPGSLERVMRNFHQRHRIEDQAQEAGRWELNGFNVEGLIQVVLKGGKKCKTACQA